MIGVDMDARVVVTADGRRLPFSSREGFALISEMWIQAGWDMKYVYGFSWMGRPVIQLPEDLLRVQEAIYAVKPDVVLETGIAHGGSLVFYASLFKAMGHGRVIGVDIEIRPPNRAALEGHELFDRITLIEGSSTDPATVERVRAAIRPGERLLVILDSNHLRDHVLGELRAYAGMVAVGSYLIATDGIMRDVAGAPRTAADWHDNNPVSAVDAFLREDDRFERSLPARAFDESLGIADNVSYFRDGWLRRVR
jgi:cephalosporin hydroxylase